MLEERRLEVLRAIVEDYVQSAEPVGSKALVERRHLNVSPATIRNDMAALEEEGYITQPHTSAGRVPTDKGYRYFVDRIAAVKPLSPAEQRAISTFLESAVDLDDVVSRTVRLLAQLTRQVAVVQYPSLQRATVRHVELVAISETRLMLVLITDTGRVEQRMVDMTLKLDEETVARLRQLVNAACVGRKLADIPSQIEELEAQFATDVQPVVRMLVATLLEMVVEQNEERIVLAGTSNLARVPGDFTTTMHPVLEALEEQVVLLRLVSNASDEVTVRIGREHQLQELEGTSLVSSGYGREGDPVATLGIVGPTRMDYSASMSAVRAVARYVGNFLTESR
jgi:heat-inducible transcriptional repressor